MFNQLLAELPADCSHMSDPKKEQQNRHLSLVQTVNIVSYIVVVFS